MRSGPLTHARRRRVRAAFCAALAAGIGCSPRPRPTASVVHIRAFEFAPAADTVQAGDTVVWTNEDVVPHTATALEKTFDSGGIEVGRAWRYVARAPGAYPYACTFHPTMRGLLVVR